VGRSFFTIHAFDRQTDRLIYHEYAAAAVHSYTAAAR